MVEHKHWSHSMHSKIKSTLKTLAVGDPNVFAETLLRNFGLKIIGIKNIDPLETRVQSESIAAMASVITEDIDNIPDIHPIRLEAKKLAEDYGYIVKVLEEMGVGTGDIGMGPGGPAVAPPKPRTKPGIKPGREKRREKRRDPFNPPRPAKNPMPKACSMRESSDYKLLGEVAGGKWKGIIADKPAILLNGKLYASWDGNEWISAKTDLPIVLEGNRGMLFNKLCRELNLIGE